MSERDWADSEAEELLGFVFKALAAKIDAKPLVAQHLRVAYSKGVCDGAKDMGETLTDALRKSA